MNRGREIEICGAFVHGILFVLHLLGALFNWLHGKKLHATAHGAAAAFDGYSTWLHVRDARRPQTSAAP